MQRCVEAKAERREGGELNPSFEPDGYIDDLVSVGKLDPGGYAVQEIQTAVPARTRPGIEERAAGS